MTDRSTPLRARHATRISRRSARSSWACSATASTRAIGRSYGSDARRAGVEPALVAATTGTARQVTRTNPPRRPKDHDDLRVPQAGSARRLARLLRCSASCFVVLAFIVIDKLTPYDLWKELMRGAQPVARHGRGRDVHRDRDHRRRRRCTEPGRRPLASGRGAGCSPRSASRPTRRTRIAPGALSAGAARVGVRHRGVRARLRARRRRRSRATCSATRSPSSRSSSASTSPRWASGRGCRATSCAALVARLRRDRARDRAARRRLGAAAVPRLRASRRGASAFVLLRLVVADRRRWSGSRSRC